MVASSPTYVNQVCQWYRDSMRSRLLGYYDIARQLDKGDNNGAMNRCLEGSYIFNYTSIQYHQVFGRDEWYTAHKYVDSPEVVATSGLSAAIDKCKSYNSASTDSLVKCTQRLSNCSKWRNSAGLDAYRSYLNKVDALCGLGPNAGDLSERVRDLDNTLKDANLAETIDEMKSAICSESDLREPIYTSSNSSASEDRRISARSAASEEHSVGSNDAGGRKVGSAEVGSRTL
jgi:hypothetical protein